jgi:hypothetical protein
MLLAARHIAVMCPPVRKVKCSLLEIVFSLTCERIILILLNVEVGVILKPQIFGM